MKLRDPIEDADGAVIKTADNNNEYEETVFHTYVLRLNSAVDR